MIIAMAMTFLISARLALIYLAAAVVLGIIMYFLITAANKHFQIVFDQYDSLNSSVQENLTGIRVVKSFAREDYEKDKFRRANQKLYTVFVKAERVVSWTSPVMNATVYTCILLISWFGAHMIVSNTLTTGELMSVLTYCMNILMSLMMLSMVMVMITMSAASARRIAEVLNEKPDIADPDSAVTEVADGSIAFHHVDFSYSGRPDHLALRDIDFSVKPGETIGILGATGSGKTSLVNLINRMYDVRPERWKSEDRMSGTMTWRLSGMRCPSFCRKTSCFPEPLRKTSAGESRMRAWRTATCLPAGLRR